MWRQEKRTYDTITRGRGAGLRNGITLDTDFGESTDRISVGEILIETGTALREGEVAS